MMRPTASSFAVLQDKFVNARAVRCCPTMDLLAVLTADRQLLVHRTVSWQKVLHLKPMDLSFEIQIMEWSPNGRALAVGGDDGSVVVYDIETGEPWTSEYRGLQRQEAANACLHAHAISVMHWTASTPESGQESGGLLDPTHRLRHRAPRFFCSLNGQASNDASSSPIGTDVASSDSNVLITADTSGRIVCWWMGNANLTKIDIASYLSSSDDFSERAYHIQELSAMPDLSYLFIMLESKPIDAGDSTSAPSSMHHLVTLNLQSLQENHEEITTIAHVAKSTQEILNGLVLAARQMTNEWKSATRIFELKMGLLESLYEKYDCQDPPQVDMISVLVSGVASPALSQYFAQDIQEMSVVRMKQAVMTGCQTLLALVEGKMKQPLVQLIFHLSEFRGQVQWTKSAYTDTFGVQLDVLNDLLQLAQDLLINMETMTHAIHETREDFGLFFEWITDRIRIHTNSPASRGASAANAADGSRSRGKSPLNQRRLCKFLERAAESALVFRSSQSSKYKVEKSFGNRVSQLLAASLAHGYGHLLTSIEEKWVILMKATETSIANSIVLERNGCLTFGSPLQECRFHPRNSYDGSDDDTVITDDNADDEEMEAVDWNSMKILSLERDDNKSLIMIIGLRHDNGQITLLRAGQQSSLSHSFALESACISFTPSTLTVQEFDFYGGTDTAKLEQIAVLLRENDSTSAAKDMLSLVRYEQMAFAPIQYDQPQTTRFQLMPKLLPTQSLDPSNFRTRNLSGSANTAASHIVANGARGIVCMHAPQSRLTVFDVDDDEEAEEEEEEDEQAE